MSSPSKTNIKDASRKSNKHLPPGRESGASNDREPYDRYRRWSPSRRDTDISRSKSDWKQRERYQHRHRPYHTHPQTSFSADIRQTQSAEKMTGNCSDVATNSHKLNPHVRNNMDRKAFYREKCTTGANSANEFHTMNKYITEKLQKTLWEFNLPKTNDSMEYTHNALIDELIAAEAIKMLSDAASTNGATSLNEPLDEPESSPSLAAISSRNTTKTVPVAPRIINKATMAADNVLLQKSAEQVTRKLLNQLTTMSKDNLKQMINNPAGKYETALNKHAQNKLRAEVRRQLKNFNLVDVRPNDSSSDITQGESIDTEKIPEALLAQIGQVFDLRLFNLAGESVETQSVIIIDDDDQSVSREIPPTSINNECLCSEQQKVANNSSNCSIAGSDNLASKTNVVKVPIAENHPPPPQLNPTAKARLFLRVSTVDELNKRVGLNAEKTPATREMTAMELYLSGKASSATNLDTDCQSTASSKTAVSGEQAVAQVASVTLRKGSRENSQQFTNLSRVTALTVSDKKAEKQALNKLNNVPLSEQTVGKNRNADYYKPLEKVSPSKGTKKHSKWTPVLGPASNKIKAATVPQGVEQPKDDRQRERRSPLPPSLTDRDKCSWRKQTSPSTKTLDTGHRRSNDPWKSQSSSKAPMTGNQSTSTISINTATNITDDLRTKSPTPVAISTQAPPNKDQQTERRNYSGKGCWNNSNPMYVGNELRHKDRGRISHESETSASSSKRRRSHSGQPQARAEDINKDIHSRIENAAVPQIENEHVRFGNVSGIRISDIRSLVETSPQQSKRTSAGKKPLPVTENEVHPPDAAKHRTKGTLLNGDGQHFPPNDDTPAMILPDFDSGIQNPYAIFLDRIQSTDSLTMELFKRKMDIDANIMKLNAERMEIDQELVQLQNERDEEMKHLRFALLQFLPPGTFSNINNNPPIVLPPILVHGHIKKGQRQHSSVDRADLANQDGSSSSGDTRTESIGIFSDTPADIENLRYSDSQNVQQQSSINQERTIRRITMISGNSELMRILQRRRLPSEQPLDENPAYDDGSKSNMLSPTV